MSKLKELLQKVETLNRRHGLFQKNDSLVVGVSGGADSMSLLWLLKVLKEKYAFKINVAHVNHGLLKNESRKYFNLVKKTSEIIGTPFYSKSVDLRSLAKKHKRSLEEMGRIERYSFFEEIAAKTRSHKIVTAHTLDDQAETVLLRLLRGSGLKGLIGIPHKRRQGRFQVVRPLLSTEKKDLLVFLKENNLPYLQDKTNKDTAFTRNRVRRRLLPVLAKYYNPQIKNSLANLQSICEEIQDYLDKTSSRALRTCLMGRTSGNKVALRLKPLNQLHPAIRREVLLKALSDLKGDRKRFSYEHISAVVEIIQSKENDLERHLPHFIVAKKNWKTLELILKRR